MPELDSTVLDSPEAMNKGGISTTPVQKVKSPSPEAATPPPLPVEILQQSHNAYQPPLPTPPRIYEESNSNKAIFCLDFQNKNCQRGNLCNYIHCAMLEAANYKSTKKLPMEVIIQNQRIICVDYAEGDCKKFTGCKLLHIPAEIRNSHYHPYHKAIKRYDNSPEPYISPNMQYPTNMYNSNNDPRHYNNSNNNTEKTKLWFRLNLDTNGSTYTQKVTAAMFDRDIYGESTPSKYLKTNEEQKVHVCTCNEQKVKEMEQSMAEIAEKIKEIKSSLIPILDIIEEIVRPNTGAKRPSMLQTAMGNHQTYTSPYPPSICSQNHV